MNDLNNNNRAFWWVLVPCRIEFHFYFNPEDQSAREVAQKLLGDNWLE